MVSGGVLATTVLNGLNPTSPPDSTNIPGVTDWYLPGSPPVEPSDPAAIPVPWGLMTVN